MRRRLLWIAGCLLSLALLSLLTAVLIVRSNWFYERVRERLQSTIEKATGGKVELARFHFAWTHMVAEGDGMTLHGTEPAGKPPLFAAKSIRVGLKIISLFKQDVDIQSLRLVAPHVYLIIGPDGQTNIPAPKIRQQSGRDPVETLLKLAIGTFQLEHGEFEIESRGKTQFDAQGRNFDASLAYDLSGPGYRGKLSIQPLDISAPGIADTAVTVAASVAVMKNRISVESARLATGGSQLEVSGTLDSLASPHAAFQYRARLAAGDASRILKTKLLERGTVETSGKGTWTGGSQIALDGSLHGSGLEYRDRYVRLYNFRVDGALSADAAHVQVARTHLAGAAVITGSTLAVEGRLASASLHSKDLDLEGVALAVLGGTFNGTAKLNNLDGYHVRGEIAGFDARRTVAVYSREPLPWNGLASGQVQLDGSLRHPKEFRGSTSLAVAPAGDSAPVHGQIAANYQAATGVLDLGHSTMTLPNSYAEISGAIGRELRVHLETRNLNDILPALGQSASAIPIRLENGRGVFDGSVTGRLDHPQIQGRLSASHFSYGSTLFDELQTEVTITPEDLALRNSNLTQGPLKGQFEIALALQDWKTSDDSAVFGSATIRNAPVADLLKAVRYPDVPVSGDLNATAEIRGTIANPLLNATFRTVRARYRDEPVDSVAGQLTYTNRTLQLSGGEITAGPKHIQLAAEYTHPPNQLETGRVHFQISSNQMPLEQIRTLALERPGLQGIAQFSAQGTLEIVAAQNGRLPIRVNDWHSELTARGLQLTGQALGDLHLTANSQGQVLKAHLESDFADSAIRGDGEWQLTGDYPGAATVKFSKVNFAQLRAWITSSPDSAIASLAGSAEGSLRLEGPALQPRAMKAELRIPSLEIGPAPGTGLSAGNFTLHNAGDIVVVMANSVVTVDKARLTGHNTDFTIGGRVSVQQRAPLDLRLAGKADLAMVHDWNPDLNASGTLNVDASVRGTTASPQITGRVEFQKAGFNIVDVPNGISNATGTILFAGDRASVQNFTGETGGGKIQLTGFVSYGGGPAVFRLRAEVQQVRVRYPEGVSTVADANLNFTGTTDRSMLSGSITVVRTGFNPQSDFSSLIAQSAEPVRTPSARTGLLGGLNFDVQIATAPDIQVQSSLTQDIQVEANLRVRGSFSNPAVLGRVNITHGQLVFFGTKYNISQGSVAFYNPLAVDPIVDIDLETKARGIEVNLNVSGPLNKLNLTPRSDPPLQFNEIVALLATGRAPTADTALLSGQNTAAPSFQQMGASALLGQAIASPVTGRLQRFFGVSRLRIDPTLPGVEYNPQARLTLEQQVTQDVTFTYITDVTSSNPQVVSVEWAFAKRWSVVAQREENGMVGMDIFFKKRF